MISIANVFSSSGLPSEALEEFLSILKPSFLPPRSPVLHTRRHGASLPNFQSDRTYTIKGRASKLDLLQATSELVEELESARSTASSRTTHTPDAIDTMGGDYDFLDADNNATFRWFASTVLCTSLSFFMTTSFPLTQFPSFQRPRSLARTLGILFNVTPRTR